MFTPWGPSQSAKTIGRGIIAVTTAGHGGFFVPADVRAEMAEPLRIKDGWYEEDCDYAKVVVAFPDLFTEEDRNYANSTMRHYFPKILAALEVSTDNE